MKKLALLLLFMGGITSFLIQAQHPDPEVSLQEARKYRDFLIEKQPEVIELVKGLNRKIISKVGALYLTANTLAFSVAHIFPQLFALSENKIKVIQGLNAATGLAFLLFYFKEVISKMHQQKSIVTQFYEQLLNVNKFIEDQEQLLESPEKISRSNLKDLLKPAVAPHPFSEA